MTIHRNAVQQRLTLMGINEFEVLIFFACMQHELLQIFYYNAYKKNFVYGMSHTNRHLSLPMDYPQWIVLENLFLN